MQLQNLKIKEELAPSKYFISAWWLVVDLIDIFNTDRKNCL